MPGRNVQMPEERDVQTLGRKFRNILMFRNLGRPRRSREFWDVRAEVEKWAFRNSGTSAQK